MTDPVQLQLVYGELTVVESLYIKKRRMYRCTCSCGKEIVARRYDIESGKTRSCGHTTRTQQGRSNTPTYWTWVAMTRRCNDPTFVTYPLYGGRGIKVCKEWSDKRTGLSRFIADMGERPEGMTLDRKNVYGNYEPGNCKWSTKVEQEHNKRRHYTSKTVAEELSESAYWDEQEKQYAKECVEDGGSDADRYE